MRRLLILLHLALLLAVALSARGGEGDVDDEVMIEDFGSPSHTWAVMNDPVMGGQSTSAYANQNGTARFTGVVAVVPFLRAPGFVKLQTGGYGQGGETFPDLTSCTSLRIVMRSNVPYSGYRIGFGTKRSGMHGRGYKAPALDVPPEFDEVVVPFDRFSLHWDEATGDVVTACSDDASVCPDVATLRNMKALAFWGEGVEGEIDLEVKSISAAGCGDGEADRKGAVFEENKRDGDAVAVEAEEDDGNPYKETDAGIARWTLHAAKWGTVSCASADVLHFGGHDSNYPDSSQPFFARVIPYATDEGTGRIFFNLMGRHHLEKSTLTVSQAGILPDLFAIGGCGTSTDSVADVQDPRCVKVSVSGAIHPCDAHEAALDCNSVGRKALYAAHPTMKDWPEDHGFAIHELVPRDDGFWMIANFGGGAMITLAQYSLCGKDAIKPHEIRGGSAITVEPFHGDGSPSTMPVWSNRAERARWLVHNSLWASLVTVPASSNQDGGGTFGNIRAITDGATLALSNGLPVFHLPDVDPAAVNMRVNDIIALTFTEAAISARVNSEGETCAGQDAGFPTCAQLVIYGKAKALDTGSTEHKEALENFGRLHPLASWLSQGGSHMPGSYYTIEPTSISILDFMGGAVEVKIEEYLGITFDDEHVLSHPPAIDQYRYSITMPIFMNVIVGLIIGVLCGCCGNSWLRGFWQDVVPDKNFGTSGEYGSLAEGAK